ncbi:MAG: paraquat-inducible protein A [Burkholderiaceae bacterium]
MIQAKSAKSLGLARCHVCAFVSRLDEHDQERSCPRCGSLIHSRKPQSLARTWAYLIAGFVLYIPANVLPMMHTRTIFYEQNDTILSGILYLWNNGSWGLALIVFVASIMVPLVKLLSLSFLAFSIQRRSGLWLLPRTQLYRLVELIGRWSMLDVYVLALLTSLVQNPAVADVRPGPAAIAFASVVVLTLLASRSFDARLLWDAAAEGALAPIGADPAVTLLLPEARR